MPETCRIVIPIKLEFSASVGFIHKESVTMHGHASVINLTVFLVLVTKSTGKVLSFYYKHLARKIGC